MMFDRYLNPADQNLRRVTKADKDFAKRLDFKDIKFSVRIRDIHKIKKRSTSVLAFLVMESMSKLCIKTILRRKKC